MSDLELLTAKLNCINANIQHTFRLTIIIIGGCTLMGIIFGASLAHAASTPKPTPGITNTWCVSNVTGAPRIALDKNGVVQACRKTEQQVTIVNLDSAPAPLATATPAPGDPTPTDTAEPTPTAAPGAPGTASNVILDSTGKEVGVYEGAALATSELALTNINGTSVALPVTEAGFVDEAITGGYGFLTVVYTSDNCSGAPNIILGSGVDPETGQPLDFLPLTQTTTNGGSLGAYIYQGVAYYAAQPYSLIQYNSTESFVNPEGTPLSGCQSGFKTQQGVGGPVNSFSLSGLGLTPPFTMAQ